MRTSRTTKRADAEHNPSLPPSAEQSVNGKAKAAVKVEQDDGLSFWEFLNDLGEKWSTGNFKLYCYRVWPAIERREPGGVYLAQMAEPIDEQVLLERFGSGRYLLMVKNRAKLLRKHTCSVHDPLRPPKVDPAEVLHEPVNDAYFAVWGKKPNDGADKPQKEPQAQTDVNAVVNTVLDKAGKFDPKLADLWERTAKERDELSKALAARNAPPTLWRF